MTGFSKSEITEEGITATAEMRCLNGKFLDMTIRLPRHLLHLENEIRDIIRKGLTRGSVNLTITLDFDQATHPLAFNLDAAAQYQESLNQLRQKLKIREAVKLEHLIKFSDYFISQSESDTEKLQAKLILRITRDALRELNNMRLREGNQIAKDISQRMKKVQSIIEKLEVYGLERIPKEREKYRQKVAQLFESDEIDEHRIQMEVLLLADKLDISEECVRMHSHIKFFFDAAKDSEPTGRKINFLLQEMNREVNTIGSKANDSQIAHYVVNVKEEIERIREQIQNVE